MANAEISSKPYTSSKLGFLSGTWPKFWLLLLVAGLPMMYPYFTELWKVERYRYFPFALIAVGYLVYIRSDGKLNPPRSWFSWCAIGVGLFSIGLAALTQYPWFAAFGMVTIATCCLSAMQGPHDRSLLGIAVTLWILVKLPFRIDNTFVSELQKVTTSLSSVMLDFFAVPHAADGNVLKLADRELFVAEACSGVQSVFTLAFVACLLISIFRLRLWMFPVYLCVAVFLAVAANIMRVTSIAIAASWYELDLATGWGHEAVGYLCLAIAIGFLLSFDRLAVILFHDMGAQDKSSGINPFMSIWDWMSLKDEDGFESADDAVAQVSSQSPQAKNDKDILGHLTSFAPVKWVFVALVAVLSLASLVTIMNSTRVKIAVGEDAMLFEPQSDVVSGKYGILTVLNHKAERGGEDARLGKNADIWDCVTEDGKLKAQLVLSQSYAGWKELCVCYEGRSWKLVDRTVEQRPRSELEVSETYRTSYAMGRFKGNAGENAYLFFSAIRPDGTVMPALTGLGALGNRFAHRFDMSGVWELDDVMMLQMFIVTAEKLPPTILNKLEEDFVQFRSQIANSAMGAAPEKVTAAAASVPLPNKRPIAVAANVQPIFSEQEHMTAGSN